MSVLAAEFAKEGKEHPLVRAAEAVMAESEDSTEADFRNALATTRNYILAGINNGDSLLVLERNIRAWFAPKVQREMEVQIIPEEIRTGAIFFAAAEEKGLGQFLSILATRCGHPPSEDFGDSPQP